MEAPSWPPSTRVPVGAGVANFNLIRLSSVIPPNCKVLEVERCPFAQEGGWGDRLYAVYAEQRTGVAGEQVWGGRRLGPRR